MTQSYYNKSKPSDQYEIKLIKKKNREFDIKCKALRNRIQNLKKEVEIYKNQLKNMKKKEIQERMIQNDKVKIKIELEKIKNEKDKELLEKRERIQRYKERIKNRMEEKKNKNLTLKKKKYQSALNDKFLMKCIINQINIQQTNKNYKNHAKVKKEYNEFESHKIKRNMIKENKQKLENQNNLKLLKVIERKMMSECNELESMEKKCLASLNKRKNYNMKYLEMSNDLQPKYYYGQNRLENIRPLNSSMDNEIPNGGLKYNNSIVSPTRQSQKQINTKDRYNHTAGFQSSSMSNFRNKKTKKIVHDSKARNNNSMTLRGKMSYIQAREKDRKRNINNSATGNNRTYNNSVDKSKSKSKNKTNKNNNSLKNINKKKK